MKRILIFGNLRFCCKNFITNLSESISVKPKIQFERSKAHFRHYSIVKSRRCQQQGF